MTASWDEFGMISRLFRPLSKREPGAFDLTDDAAVLPPSPGCEWVVTADALVAGVHFFPDDPPATIAKKALRVNLSDLAAMGARPRCVFMTCAFPEHFENQWIEEFSQSLGEDFDYYNITLCGGDVVATPGPLTLSITAMGEVPSHKVLRRNAAKPGDIIAVTGTLGDGALGLDLQNGKAPQCLKEEDRLYLTHRYRIPLPRVSAGQALNGIAHAGLDISDGLIADLRHMAIASGCNITIDPNRLPLSVAARSWLDARPEDIERILTGGDDYELAFSCAPEVFTELSERLDALNIITTAIGRAEVGDGKIFKINANGQRVLVEIAGGHRHG